MKMRAGLKLLITVLTPLYFHHQAWAQESNQGQTPSSGSASTETKSNSGDADAITVKGKTPDVTDKLDRRVYNMKNDPSAGTGMATDLLEKVPSVQVSPSGTVTLRGDPHVTIMIDGKIPSNGNQALQSLSAADIDRIEVITNPSAEYSSSGSAGIINLITKKKFPLGFSGSLKPTINSTKPSWVSGLFNLNYDKWSAKLSLNFNDLPSDFHNSVSHFLPNTGQSQTKEKTNRFTVLHSLLTLGYKLDENNSLALTWNDEQGRVERNNFVVYNSPSTFFNGDTLANDRDHNVALDANYTYTKDFTGTTFTLDVSHAVSDSPFTQITNNFYLPMIESNFGQTATSIETTDGAKVDFEKDFSDGKKLTTGFEYNADKIDDTHLYFDTGGVVGPYMNGADYYLRGERGLSSVYVTWLQSVGEWTALYGLRGEKQTLSIQSNGLGLDRQDTGFYPSFNLSHGLSEHSKLKLSYSRRVDRPDITEYDPGAIFADSVSRQTGNPDLKTPKTDSVEIDYVYIQQNTNVEAALFSRKTQDFKTTETYVDASGIIVTHPFNDGESTSSGVSLTLKAPVMQRLTYSLNLNLLHNSLPMMAGGTFAYNTVNENGLLEYDAAKRGALTGDVYQLKLNYTGRYYNPQGYTEAYHSLNTTWQHSLSQKWVLVVDGLNLTNGRSNILVINTTNLKYRSKHTNFGPALRIGLSYRFGKN